MADNPSTPVLAVSQSITYLRSDLSGNVIAGSSNGGELLWKQFFDAYGVSQINTGQRLGYDGFSTDEEGLIYMGARIYDPAAGQFLSPDPVDQLSGVEKNPKMISRYAYANNNPINYGDPDGNSPIDLAFLAWDVGKLSVALYKGEGVKSAMVDVGLSTAGVLSILTGLGQGLKVARAAKTIETVGNGAENVNAGVALNRKLSALEGAQQNAAKVRQLPDGRIRYYEAERAANKLGPTRGSSYVTEYNPANGNVRSWNEAYYQVGNVNRVHPKMINGQVVNSQYFPPSARELGL